MCKNELEERVERTAAAAAAAVTKKRGYDDDDSRGPARDRSILFSAYINCKLEIICILLNTITVIV